MGIFSTILFATAALAAVMTILSTVRVYATEFAALRVQLADADTARLIVWRIVEPQLGRRIAQAPKSPYQLGSTAQGSWARAPLPGLAA